MNREQVKLCTKYGVPVEPPETGKVVGVALQTLGQQPINGLRHVPEGGGSGWFIWAGQGGIPQNDPHFFQPECLSCFVGRFPDVEKYLALPPGYRFLIDDQGYEDVWYDEKLLKAA